MFFIKNVWSLKSPTFMAPKSNKFYVLSPGNFKSTVISKASAYIGISIGLLNIFIF
jgi:hypothetical protein